MTERIARNTGCLAILIALSTAPALAQDASFGDAGIIQVHTTACMLAKSNRKPPCPLPEFDGGSDPAQGAAARLNRAKYFIDMGNLKDAFVEADEALKLTPGDIDTRHLVARLALSIGDSGRAEREIRIVLQRRPNDANLQATDASRLMNTRSAEALRLFDRILDEHPDHQFSRESRAKLRLMLGFSAEAIDDLGVLLAKRPRNLNFLSLRANAYVCGRKFKASSRRSDRSLERVARQV